MVRGSLRYRSGPELESVPSGVGSFVSQPQVVSAGVALPELDIHWPDPPHGPLGRREVGFRLQSCEVARDDAISFLKIEKRCTLTTRQGDRLRRWVACSEVRDGLGRRRPLGETSYTNGSGQRYPVERERDMRVGIECLPFADSSPVAISNDPSAVTSLSTRMRASGRPSRSTVDNVSACGSATSAPSASLSQSTKRSRGSSGAVRGSNCGGWPTIDGVLRRRSRRVIMVPAFHSPAR